MNTTPSRSNILVFDKKKYVCDGNQSENPKARLPSG